MSSSAKRICLESSRHQETQVTIDQLPDNVLEEVFRYLNARELKNAALVCKNWNEVIGSAAVTMEKFKIVIDHSKITQPINLARKHQNIEMKFFSCPDALSLMVNLNLLIMSQARSFKFQCYGRIDSEGLTLMLWRMPLLEELSIESARGFNNYRYTKVNLPRLKKIKVIGVEILKHITANNVTEVDFSSFYLQPSTQSASKGELVSSFFKKCKKINRLNMDLGSAFDFLTVNWKDCNLKLSTFQIKISFSYSPDNIPKLIDGFKSFAMSQAATLNDLTLCIALDLPSRKEVISNLRGLTSLEHLKVYGEFDDITDIARFYPKLKYLSVFGTSMPLETGLEMNNLEHLVVTLADHVAMKSIILSSPKLETVDIENYDDVKHEEAELVKLLLKHPKVKHLKFTGFPPFKRLFDRISSGYGNLKSVEFKEFGSCLSIKFNFPANPHEWNVIEQRCKLDEKFAGSEMSRAEAARENF